MKIAYIGIKGLPARGDADRVVEAIVRRLAGQHELTVYCSRRYAAVESPVQGVRLVHLPDLGGKYSSMTSLDFLAAWHAVLYGDYDLIHLHNIEASFTLPILKLRYKVISAAHGRITAANKWGRLPAALLRSMEIPFARLSNALTGVSQQDAQYLTSRFQRTVAYKPRSHLKPWLNSAGDWWDRYLPAGMWIMLRFGSVP